MSFRAFSHRYMEKGAMWTMIFGIVCLCQPWIGFLHAWSVGIMILGLIGFLVAVHVPAPDEDETPEQGGEVG